MRGVIAFNLYNGVSLQMGVSVFDLIIFAFFALIFALGVVTALFPAVFGLKRHNLSDRYTWGLNVQGFLFLSTVACGILVVISASIIIKDTDSFTVFLHAVADVPGILVRIDPLIGIIFQLAATIAFGCLIGAQMLMALDLGRPFRALKIITGRNLASPLTLDFILLIVLTGLSFVFMFGIFMNVHEILILWAYATLFLSLLCMLAHVMLFILKAAPGLGTRSFESVTTVACGIWSGSAVISLFMPFHHSFAGVFLIATMLVFASQVAVFIGCFAAGKKPYNLTLTSISFVVLIFLVARTLFMAQHVWIVSVIYVFVCILAIVAVFIEKIETVLNHQKLPVLPAPYNMYDKVKAYRPSIPEVGGLVAGFSLVVCIFYAVVIFRAYALPWIINLFL